MGHKGGLGHTYLLVEPVVSGANRESVRCCPCGHCALSRCSVDMEALQFSSGAALVSCRHLGSCFGIVMRRFLYWVGPEFHHGGILIHCVVLCSFILLCGFVSDCSVVLEEKHFVRL